MPPRFGASHIYVLPAFDPARSPTPSSGGALDAALNGLRLMVANRLGSDIEQYADKAELVVLPARNPGRVQPSDFDHATALIECGYKAAQALLAERDTGGANAVTARG
jgi:hypothetical protein